MQHIAIAWELGEQTPEGWMDYSDHLGVRADVNAKAPRCSPNDQAGPFGPQPVVFTNAQDVAFGTTGNPNDPTRITFPGSMQWYRIDEPGSYEIRIGTNDANVDYEVYEHTDLSRPIWNFHKESNDWGDVYSLPDPPYYIRVFAPGRTWADAYSIHFHKNLGLSKTDAIALTANARMPYTWPGPNTVPVENPQTRIWFKFYTDVASSGAHPETSVLQEFDSSYVNLARYHMDLVTDDPPTLDPNNVPVYKVIATDGGSTITNPNTNHDVMDFETPPLDGGPTGPQVYYARLWRDPAVQGSTEKAWVTFGTTLTYFRPLRLTAQDAWDDDPEDDQLDLLFAFDGLPGDAACGPCVGPLEFDSEQIHPLSGYYELSGSYTKNFVPQIWEEGDYMAPGTGGGDNTALSHMFGMLGNEYPQQREYLWADDYNIDDADYWYEMVYMVSAEEFPKCADAPAVEGCIPW